MKLGKSRKAYDQTIPMVKTWGNKLPVHLFLTNPTFPNASVYNNSAEVTSGKQILSLHKGYPHSVLLQSNHAGCD